MFLREREREAMRIGHFQDSTFPCAPTDHLTQTINNLKKLSANNLHFQSNLDFMS